MKAYKLTKEQILECDGKNYNPRIWNENVNGMTKYDNVVFYVAKADDKYSYDRYFVEYTIPEGIRFFTSFGYSFAITSNPFSIVDIQAVRSNGKSDYDIVREFIAGNFGNEETLSALLAETPDHYLITRKGVMINGQEYLIEKTKKARTWMAERSKIGITFTSDSF